MNAIVLLALGATALIAGAEMLVRGASRISATLGIPPLVIGLTVVAFGTSSPELAVSLKAALGGSADIAVGNVVGSNIFNVLAILGLSAAVAPLLVQVRLVRADVPVMIGLSAALLIVAVDGRVSRWEGALFVAFGIVHTVLSVRAGRRAPEAVGRREALPAESSRSPRGGALVLDLVLIAAGLTALVFGSGWLVDGAIDLARRWGVGEMVIGLTVVAAGTSLPELATSVLASARGERDIAVGNVVGSNIFNLWAVLGVAAVVAPSPIAVSRAALVFDLPVMTAVAFACLPVFFTGYRISRAEGVLFLAYYAAYVLYLLLAASQHDLLAPFSGAMLLFAMPLTAITLAIVAWRAWAAKRRRPPAR